MEVGFGFGFGGDDRGFIGGASIGGVFCLVLLGRSLPEMKGAGTNRSLAAVDRAVEEWENLWKDISHEACGAPFRSRSGLLVCFMGLFFEWLLIGYPIFGPIMSGRLSRTIYVGNLPLDIRESEVEDLFYKYGRIVEIELKNPPRPPGYCFVEFESSRDADDAIRGRDGHLFDGYRLKVELAHGGRGQSSSIGRSSGYGSGGSRKYGVSHRSEFRVIVHGLPSSASWQDLKDHMRKAGDVCFAQVFRDHDGTVGLVDYTNYEDMKYAIRKLDDTEFKNPWARSYIHVKIHEGSVSRSQSPSRSRSISRSPRRNWRSRSSSRSG
ncbi:hypothetical protein J5N97_025554 [Dioscorea zingiberensis]|uniref:RRM domain-containing protein n=1 Tax=Dioscorea zingiberensis TaxID=325984 RepID=A0A9D5C9N8_9LILI|nr:hypothetical protein J5N97_025554 [Dioscorea zingiberensis]